MLRFLVNFRFRSFILTLTALSLLLGNAWVPLPIPVEKDLSVPFPCQDKGCGCKDAQQCWENCCCHSDAEKLAWANRNQVKPPDWFMRKVAVNKILPAEDSCSKKCCCCCSKNKSAATDKKQKPKTTVFLVLRQQQNCQGQIDGVYSFDIQLGLFTPPPRLDPLTPSPLFGPVEAQLSSTFLGHDPRPS